MKYVFLMDPLEMVDPKKDTTWLLMSGAVRAGHLVYYLPDGGISLNKQGVRFDAVRVVPKNEGIPPFIIEGTEVLETNDIDAVFIRTNPPFNERYLMNTWLLEQLPPGVLVINRPSGIRSVNEKIWVSQFRSLTPNTLISRNIKECLEFVDSQKDVIMKPTDGFGGIGVFHLRSGDSNLHVTLETLTEGGKKEAILQRYVEASDLGDKRIFLLNGDPLGAVLRVHSKEDHRNNFYSGGHPEPADITDTDYKIIDTLKPHLNRLGLMLVGIDIIGEFLIEVNVTSPTCLQEINRLNNVKSEDKIIEFVDKVIEDLRLSLVSKVE